MSFTPRNKNILAYIRSLITTDAGARVLVGENEDEVLIWTATTTGWDNSTQNATSFTSRTKN